MYSVCHCLLIFLKYFVMAYELYSSSTLGYKGIFHNADGLGFALPGVADGSGLAWILNSVKNPIKKYPVLELN